MSLLGRPQSAPGNNWLGVPRGHTLQLCLSPGPDTHVSLPGYHLGLSYNTGGESVKVLKLLKTTKYYQILIIGLHSRRTDRKNDHGCQL